MGDFDTHGDIDQQFDGCRNIPKPTKSPYVENDDHSTIAPARRVAAGGAAAQAEVACPTVGRRGWRR